MDHGLLLMRGRRDRVVRWVRRGTTPVYVVRGKPWVALVPAGPSKAMAPYQDGVTMLASHPVRRILRPAIGLWVDGGHALVTCAPRRWWRPTQHWVRWTPGEGPSEVDSFPLAGPRELARAAGFGRHPAAPAAIRGLLADPGGTAEDLLEDLATLLGLPHAQVVRGVSGSTIEGADLVLPADSSIEAFDKVVSDEQSLDAEVEEGL